MTFFTGRYDSKLDTKGRLVLPAKFKAQLPQEGGNELVIQQGIEPYLSIYPVLEFRKHVSKISGLSEFSEENRQVRLTFFSRIASVELDDNGRLLIPKNMLAYAGLQKEVVLVGMYNLIVVWEPGLFEKHVLKDQQQYSKLMEKIDK